jgi:hypothetical protein
MTEDIQNQEDIYANLEKILSKEEVDEIKNRFENQLNFFPEETKLISCPHEIVFSITANVLEENEDGHTVGSKELTTRTYHMPVPSDKDYHEFIDVFMEFFEKTMIESHTHAKQNTETKEKEPEEEEVSNG